MVSFDEPKSLIDVLVGGYLFSYNQPINTVNGRVLVSDIDNIAMCCIVGIDEPHMGRLFSTSEIDYNLLTKLDDLCLSINAYKGLIPND